MRGACIAAAILGLVGIQTPLCADPQAFNPSIPIISFGDGLNPNVNPANGPGLVATEEFLIAADQQAVSKFREGVVHVWRKQDGFWTYWQTLVDHGPFANTNRGWFGYTFDLSGDWLAIGSTNAKGPYGQGDVQMFRLNTFSRKFEFSQYLQSPDVGTGDEFGDTISLDGNWMVIGAPWHNHMGVRDTGAVWFYELVDGTTWVQRQKLLGSNTDADDWFGITVELQGSEAFVSSMFDGWGGHGSGTVYTLKLVDGTWVQTGRLKPSPVRIYEGFGACIGLDGNHLIITAPMLNSTTQIGAIYFFKRQGEGWLQTGSYVPNNVAGGEFFGRSLSVAGGLAVAGTKYGEGKRGLVHVFRHSLEGWQFETCLAPSSREPGFMFGTDVFTDGSTILCNAAGAVWNGSKRNLLYTYSNSAPQPGYQLLLADHFNPLLPTTFQNEVLGSTGNSTPLVRFQIPAFKRGELQFTEDMNEWRMLYSPLPPGRYDCKGPAASKGFFRIRPVP